MGFKRHTCNQEHASRGGRFSYLKKLANFGLMAAFFVSLIGLTAFVTSLVDIRSQTKSAELASYDSQAANDTDLPEQADLKQQPNDTKHPASTNVNSEKSTATPSQPVTKQSKPKATPKCNHVLAQEVSNIYQSKLQQENERHENVVNHLTAMLRLNKLLNPGWYRMQLDKEEAKHQNILDSLLDEFEIAVVSAGCSKNIFIKP